MHFTPVRCVNSNGSLSLARLQGPQRGQSCSVAPSLFPTNCNQFVLTTRSPTARLENCNRSLCEGDWFFTHSSVSDLNLSYFRLFCITWNTSTWYKRHPKLANPLQVQEQIISNRDFSTSVYILLEASPKILWVQKYGNVKPVPLLTPELTTEWRYLKERGTGQHTSLGGFPAFSAFFLSD